jgi:hypothetical protein
MNKTDSQIDINAVDKIEQRLGKMLFCMVSFAMKIL